MLYHILLPFLIPIAGSFAHETNPEHATGHRSPSHSHHESQEFDPAHLAALQEKWSSEWSFHGISTFAHLPHHKCLTTPSQRYDIAILGAPFDTAVSYRPGARFGPRAIRAASARQTSYRGFNHRAGINPYMSWARVMDCGDIPVVAFDNAVALRQMTEAYTELASRMSHIGGNVEPRIITLGGDHSVALAALRALKELHGPIAVLHFDAHLDTWHPDKNPSAWGSEQMKFNHGSMFWMASQEGLIASNASVHGGLRTRLSGVDYGDYADDEEQGFLRIEADEIDDIGVKGVVAKIINRMSGQKVYLSVDIDVIDPGLCPATGTPEPGGWTSRELIGILRGIEGLDMVGADVVEVAPAYDGPGEVTALTAAQIVYEIISSMVKKGAGEGLGGTNKEEKEKVKVKGQESLKTLPVEPIQKEEL